MGALTDDQMKKIIARRDRRYDGRFYFGVKTTGIYCRPVCPAKANPKNIQILRSVAEAELLGFRACLRCHPELAPGVKRHEGTWNTVNRALRLMQDGALDELKMDRLAQTLGVTDRHLRRLFADHLGASPIDVIITQRLQLAKQMLSESSLPITAVAFASGFQSIRRFNEAFKSRYGQSPRQYRSAPATGSASSILLKIPVRLPYDWDSVIAYLARHETFGVESVTPSRYRRYVPHEQAIGTVDVYFDARAGHLDVHLTDVPLNLIRLILGRLKCLFDTEHDPLDLPQSKSKPSAGIRVPGCFDPFETAIAIILSQLVSTAHAKATMYKLVQTFGQRLGEREGASVYQFPSPTKMTTAPLEQIGITRAKAAAIRELAAAVLSGHIDFTSQAPFAEITNRLLAIKGIGPWTAEMVAMRCLGDPDAFPQSDLIVKRVIEEGLVDHVVWQSSRAYLTHCLWRDYGKTLNRKAKGKTA